MNKETSIKILGYVVTIGGVAVSLLSSFVSEKKLDSKVEREVEKAITRLKGE